MMPLTKFVGDIEKFEHRYTLPRTWADRNENTSYYE